MVDLEGAQKVRATPEIISNTIANFYYNMVLVGLRDTQYCNTKSYLKFIH